MRIVSMSSIPRTMNIYLMILSGETWTWLETFWARITYADGANGENSRIRLSRTWHQYWATVGAI